MFARSLAAIALVSVLVVVSTAHPNPIITEDLTSPVTTRIDGQFYTEAMGVNTDKSWDHSYHYLYSKYLAPVRQDNLRLLEIGLGCNMGYGAGHSLELWKKYLPNTKVSFLEYDAACANKHKVNIEAQSKGTLFIGDQANETLLHTILQDSTTFGGYDVIIDDGGHTSHQMLTSIKILWQALRPGGVYIVEDTSENYIEKPFLDPSTFMAFMKQAVDVVQCRMKPAYMEPDSVVRKEFKEFCAKTDMDIISVECIPEACALVKGQARQRLLSSSSSSGSSSTGGRHKRHAWL